MIELTSFSSIFDNKTHRHYSFDEWQDFVEILFELSTKSGYKPKRGERTKNGSPLITPAVYKDNTTRANANVLRWGGWAALDVDDYEMSFEDSLKPFQNYEYVCYSSASSTKDHPRYRIVFRLDGSVEAKNISHFWYALNQEFNELGDKQTKDLSRMYYVPAQFPNAYNFIFRNEGEILSSDVLMNKHAYKVPKQDFLSNLPSEMQRALLQQKKANLNNRNYAWSSYRDCPFVNQKMIEHFRTIANTDGSGRYSYFYKLMLNIAGNAIRRHYPITANEIVSLLRELDTEYGNRYKKRRMDVEAQRAIDFVLKNEAKMQK